MCTMNVPLCVCVLPLSSLTHYTTNETTRRPGLCGLRRRRLRVDGGDRRVLPRDGQGGGGR